ncbi:MAG TPA: hypothetical protein VHX61_09305 [Rhizomicrobium sp.]|jgi:hypothetical protein|nr:hypothetical protein [Rhizomicrobium sp.]
MPRSTAQWTGFAVTVIVVLGRDFDILSAIPLGLAACVLAGFFADFPGLPVLRRIRGSWRVGPGRQI